MTSAQRGPKPTKPYANYGKDSISAVRRRDRIKSLAMRIGKLSVKEYRALPSGERAELTRKARLMYDLGMDTAVAERAEKVVRSGFVYIITNPAWPAHCKVGRAFDPEARLASYQTGAPDRDYRLRYAVYFDDCFEAERLIHDTLADYRAEGEWYRILPSTVEHVLDMIGGYI